MRLWLLGQLCSVILFTGVVAVEVYALATIVGAINDVWAVAQSFGKR
jgi:hypothetical protein